MTSGIGKPLTIVEYDPEWPRLFGEIRGTIQRTIPGTYHSVEHVGSTSVPGMAAKPIIDIDIVIREGMFDRIKRGLESLGYVDEGDLGIPGRTAFDLQDPALRAALAPHHLYVVAPDSRPLRDHRDFRDYLLAHPEWRERMSALKRELAVQYADDREGYQRAKSGMVEEVLRLARASSPPGPLSLRGEGEQAAAEGRAAER
jgi:GrpB-like predicted nucleotidyltransferase (UPF0157 family)